MDVQVVRQTTAAYRSLADEVRDPTLMAADLPRETGPAVFWNRRLPIIVRAVLVAVRQANEPFSFGGVFVLYRLIHRFAVSFADKE